MMDRSRARPRTLLLGYLCGMMMLFLVGMHSETGWAATENIQICQLIQHNIDYIHDGDGLEIADMNDDGKMDVVIAESAPGKVAWYEQNTPYSWTRHEVVSGFEKIEGLDILEIEGNAYIVILDQMGEVAIAGAKHGDVKGKWEKVTIDSKAPYVQCSLEADIDEDGDLDLFYSYEGEDGHEGGQICWLENLEGSVLEKSNWKKHTLSATPGAWWIAQHRIDINGDGKATEIVFTSRYSEEAGIFWAEPDLVLTDPWIVHTIEDNSDYSPLHVTVGNFFGDGHSNDIAAAAMNEGSGAYLYRYSEEYAREVIREDGNYHNIVALDLDNKDRDELLLVRGKALLSALYDNIMLYQYEKGGYVYRWKSLYRKADDRIIPYDLTGDGYAEIITVAANDNSVDWWEVSFGICPSPLFWDIFTILMVLMSLAVAVLILRGLGFKNFYSRFKERVLRNP